MHKHITSSTQFTHYGQIIPTIFWYSVSYIYIHIYIYKYIYIYRIKAFKGTNLYIIYVSSDTPPNPWGLALGATEQPMAQLQRTRPSIVWWLGSAAHFVAADLSERAWPHPGGAPDRRSGMGGGGGWGQAPAVVRAVALRTTSLTWGGHGSIEPDGYIHAHAIMVPR